MGAKQRFYEIDFLRFIAAISVVLFHYTFRGHSAGYLIEVSFPVLGEFFKYGFYGVNLFFIISGFVILLTATDRSFSKFVISRVTRLYPAFWIGATITTLVATAIGGYAFHVGLLQYLANLSMISGYFGVKNVDGVYWTLLVEIKFYVLVSVVVFFKQTKNIKYYIFGWLFLSMASVFVALPHIMRSIFLVQWSSYFIAGSLFYLIRREGPSLILIMGVFLAYCLSIVRACENIPHLAKIFDSQISFIVVISIISSFYFIFIVLSTRRLTFFNRKIFLYFGILTYPLYLIHQNVGYMVFNYFGEIYSKYVILCITISAILILSYVIGNYFERYLVNILKNALARFAMLNKQFKVIFLKVKG